MRKLDFLKTTSKGVFLYSSLLSCKAIENKNEKNFSKVLHKSWDNSNGKLLLFEEFHGDYFINHDKNISIKINGVPYIMSIEKNNKIHNLNILDNTGIESLTFFTGKGPITSLKNCNKLTKIKLEFDYSEDTKYLKDVLNVMKNVKNLTELDLSALYYYCFSGYKKDILVVIDNIITSLKGTFPNLKYIFPDIYKKSKDYDFVNFKNKKEILDIVTVSNENLLNNYKEKIEESLKTFYDYYNTKIKEYIETVDNELLKKKESLNVINGLFQSKEYFEKINELNKQIKEYKDKLNSKLECKERVKINNTIRNLSFSLTLEDRNAEKNTLEEQITKLKQEKEAALSFPSYVEKKIKLLNEKKSFIENIENVNTNIKEVYDFILKLRTEGDLDIITPLGKLCPVCDYTITIKDIIDEDFKITTPCNHIFHKTCIDEWLKMNNSCPMCREKIDND